MMKIIYNKEKKYVALIDEYVSEKDFEIKKFYVTFDRKIIYSLIKIRKLDKEKLYQDGVIELA